MMTVLVLSVGGSSEPIVHAIREHAPDFVYFLCSSGPGGSQQAVDGPGTPCDVPRKGACPSCGKTVALGQARASIVRQVQLAGDRYEKVFLDDPDDIDECYNKVAGLAAQIPGKFPPPLHVIANPTGGTKMMSFALTMVAVMTRRWDLSLNKGTRIDLVNVSSGTDIPVVIDKWKVFFHSQMGGFAECLERYDYPGAERILSQLALKPLDIPLTSRLQRSRQLLKAFECWDRFDHRCALSVLRHSARGEFAAHLVALKRILGQAGKASGYELVEDLLLNAERRAVQNRYDDAVARLYRATELAAQVRLKKKHGLDTGNILLENLPPGIAGDYETRVREQGRVLLGLREAYELLYKLDDAWGRRFKEQETGIIGSIRKRNESIFAHGSSPLCLEDFRDVREKLSAFIQGLLAEEGVSLEAPQFPTRQIAAVVDPGAD